VPLLICPVRSCGEPLPWDALRCPRGHSFDRARSGYVNLLQPQDRKSKQPGDSRATVQARRRSLERGLGHALREALVGEVGRLRPANALDIGCGDGFYLRAIANLVLERWGVDLSSAAVELAAARDPIAHYFVANADRRLPFFEHAFKLLFSLTGPKHVAEFARLCAPDGHLLVAVAGADDLAELREAMLGKATPLDHAAAARARFEPAFKLEREVETRQRTHLDAAGLADLLATTYRGARHREQERVAALRELDVTTSHVLLTFAPR
jgi:23S rRNA (guanine745-N1)-methyltransferase